MNVVPGDKDQHRDSEYKNDNESYGLQAGHAYAIIKIVDYNGNKLFNIRGNQPERVRIKEDDAIGFVLFKFWIMSLYLRRLGEIRLGRRVEQQKYAVG